MATLPFKFDISDKKGIIVLMIGAQAALSFPFTICTFVVSGTANNGFNVVLTALLVNAFIGGSFYVVRKSKTPLAVGFLIGCSVMITFLLLMTAIFWGQLGNCESVSYDVTQYSCSQKSAYKATCAFATLLFILDVFFTAAMIMWRSEFIEDIALYDEISGASGIPNSNLGGNPYEPSKSSFSTPAVSTDL